MRLQDAGDAGMADLVAFGDHSRGDGPQRRLVDFHLDNLADGFLPGLVPHELPVDAASEPERDCPAEIETPFLVVGLALADSLAETIAQAASTLREGVGDRHDKLRSAV